MIQTLPGYGYWWPPIWGFHTNSTAYYIVDLAGEKVGAVGRVWAPGWESGTKNIRNIIFRAGYCLNLTASSAVFRVSLQNMGSGATFGPDGVDEYADVAATDIGSGSKWIRTGNLNTNRTVSPSDMVAVVIEFNPSGRPGSESFGWGVGYGLLAGDNGCFCMWNNATIWGGVTERNPMICLECDDGTYIGLDGSIPAEAGAQAISTTTGAGAEFTVPEPVFVDGAWFYPTGLAAGELVNVELYQGNTRLYAAGTVQIDGDQTGCTIAGLTNLVRTPIPLTKLLPGNTYRLALEMSSGSANVATLTAYDTAALALLPGGANWRLNTVTIATPAWGTVSTTVAPLMGLRIRKVHSGSRPSYQLGI